MWGWLKSRPIVSTLVVATLAWFAWIVFGTHAFSACMTAQENDYSNQSTPENPRVVFFLLGTLAKIFTICSWRVVYVERDAFTAIATGLVAWFTYTLWSTSKGQLTILRDSIGLSRNDFETVHRPWLEMKNFTAASEMVFYGSQVNITVGFDIQNVGNFPATDFLMYANVISVADQHTINDKIRSIVGDYRDTKRSMISEMVPAKTIFPTQVFPTKQEYVFQIADAATPFSHGILCSPLIIYVGCYKSPNSTEVKFTSCTFNVLIDGAAIYIEDVTAPIAPIAIGRMEFRPWITGWTAG